MNDNQRAIEQHEQYGEIVKSRRARGHVADNPSHEDFETLISDIQFHAVMFQRKGQLWAGGDGGVVHWEITEDEIIYRIYHSEHGLAGQDITCITTTPHVILCGHRSGYVSQFDLVNQSWSILATRASNEIYHLFEAQGIIYACTYQGIEVLNHNEITPLGELALSGMVVNGILYAGTLSGLWMYNKHTDEWKLLESLPVVKHLREFYGMVMIGCDDGLFFYSSDSGLNEAGYHEPVHNLVHLEDTGIYLLTDNTIYQITLPDHDFETVMRTDDTLLAVDEQGIATIHKGKLVFQFHKMIDPSHAIKPPPLFTVTTPQRIRALIAGEAHLFLQTVDGALWQKTESDWQRLLSPDVVIDKITGMSQVKNGYRFGLYNAVGLVEQNNNEIREFTPSLLYVRSLFEWNGYTYAIGQKKTTKATETPAVQLFKLAGEEWSSIATLPADGGSVFGYLTGNALMVVMSQGVWDVDSGTWVHHFTMPMLMATMEGDEALATDGKTVWHITTTQQSELTYSHSNHITALLLHNDTVYVGTSDGLSINDRDGWTHWNMLDSGLADNNIQQIIAVGETVYVLTGCGVQMFTGNS